ncbi:MAG: hypothetical protein J0I80_14650 [Sphingomonas sp.]|nr:hypothetical protein [Sphingomonas sp.]
MNELIEAIANSSIGIMMAENPIAFPWVETVHVVAITTVLGVIAIVDLRLLGLAGVSYPVSRLSNTLVPVTWVAFALAAITGALLFTSQPATYVENFAFQMKMLLLVAAGLNMALFHLFTMKGIAVWDKDAVLPLGARLAGLLSLVIWVLVVGFGRWIGFTMSPF